MDIACQLDAVQRGRISQFPPLVQLPLESLPVGVEVFVQLPQTCSGLFLPRQYVLGGNISSNTAGVPLGIRINSLSAAQLLWGISNSGGNEAWIVSYTGPIDRLYVTNLGDLDAPLTFVCLRGASLGFATPGGGISIVGGSTVGS